MQNSRWAVGRSPAATAFTGNLAADTSTSRPWYSWRSRTNGENAYLFPGRVDRMCLVSSGGLCREVSPLLKAASLPGSGLVLPVLASDWVRRNTAGALAQLRRLGVSVGPSPSAADTSWRSFGTVADKFTRKAFLASTRAVVGPRGQTVSAKQHFPKFDTIASLLIWGGKDTMIPASHTDNVRREVPNIRVEIFPNAGHFPQLDEPELFFRVLDEFLRSEPPAPENCASAGSRNVPWV